MKARLSFILCLILCLSTKSFSQTATLDYSREPLNDILLDLHDRFGVEISIDAALANQCLITVNQRFDSMEAALQYLAGQCNLKLVRVSDVYVFQPKPIDKPVTEKQEKKPPLYLYQGAIVEKGTDEPLPFSIVQWQGGGVVSDENGRFSFKSYQQEERGTFRYLGYETADTLVQYGSPLTISLDPKLLELATVEVVSARGVAPLTNIGGSAGYIQFNDINNNLVPGLSDNLIFNNLRLYPGIMAAGESISDFVIWGSYAGQNHVIYDGISLFNSWGVNDDMGRVNPYMIKNVKVYKGGYNVQHGDRIGGVVLMDARSGNKNQAEGSVSFTNQLGNAYLNLPMFGKKATLQLAGRKTIFDAFDLSSDFGTNEDLIVPQYDYTDLNLKFTASIGQLDQLEISGILSEDEYQGTIRNPARRNLVPDLNINSEQTGSSLKYFKNWRNGGITNFTFSQSSYKPELNANYFQDRNQPPTDQSLVQYGWTNPIKEFRTGLTHTFAAKGQHQFQLNGEYVKLNTSLRSTANDRILEDADEASARVSFYVHDRVRWSDRFSMQLGLKADVPTANGEAYLQPRVNAKWDLSSRWNLHAGWGLYNQFLSKNSIVDELGNRSEVWQVADGENASVLKSTHHVLGLNYNSGSLAFGLEGFYKNSSGFKRFFFNRNGNTVSVTGEAQTLGLEAFARKRVATHEFWVSYTLSEVEERFSNEVRVSEFQQAPQSQKHELKTVASFNFSPFQFSVTNVYGSGFPNSTLIRAADEFEAYWRTDLALQYRFEMQSVRAEAGISILNFFNHRNVRLNQSVSVQNGIRINTAGIPFTPTVYLNLKF